MRLWSDIYALALTADSRVGRHTERRLYHSGQHRIVEWHLLVRCGCMGWQQYFSYPFDRRFWRAGLLTMQRHSSYFNYPTPKYIVYIGILNNIVEFTIQTQFRKNFIYHFPVRAAHSMPLRIASAFDFLTYSRKSYRASTSQQRDFRAHRSVSAYI